MGEKLKITTMFTIPKERLLANLEKIQMSLCAYRSPKNCDCKYGREGNEPNKHRGEDFSGCPEISLAIEIIKQVEYEEA